MALVAVKKDLSIPAGGQLIISATPTVDFVVIEGGVGTAIEVDIEHPTLAKGIEIDVTAPDGLFYSGQVQLPITGVVAQNDILLLYVEFKMIETADETGSGFLTAFIESPSPDFNKYLKYKVASTGAWQAYFLPLELVSGLGGNPTAVKFGFGDGTQTQKTQLANIQLLNYEQTIALEDMPATQPTYQGRESNADWRALADARIEANRKGDFTLTVEDNLGAPIIGAQVEIELTKHAYHFGSVAKASRLVGVDADSVTYREKLLENFNQSGLENGLKWPQWAGDDAPSYPQADSLTALTWLQTNELYARGHVMVWPDPSKMPDSVQQYLPAGDPDNADAQVLTEIDTHIADISLQTAGLLAEWDVLNEPYTNTYLMDAFGDTVMVDWFDEARTGNATAALYINDYGILSGGGTNVAHQDHYFDTIGYLLTNSAPVDGIGMQCHFSATPTPINNLYTVLERFSTAYPNLDIRATEFDIDTTNEAMQADYTRDFLTMFFSHPSTVGVQNWGFWAGAHYQPDAAMYDLNWNAKPNQQAWSTLINDTWSSSFDLTSDGSGEVNERGFYGTYKVDITVGGTLIHTDYFDLESGTTLYVIATP